MATFLILGAKLQTLKHLKISGTILGFNHNLANLRSCLWFARNQGVNPFCLIVAPEYNATRTIRSLNSLKGII